MKTKRIAEYISFGTSIRFLQDATSEYKVFGSGRVADNIDTLFKYLKDFNLQVTQRAAHELAVFRKTLDTKSITETLSEEDAKKLRALMEDLRKTLLAESSGELAYIVTEKRIDVDKLINDMPALIAPGVFDSMPHVARYDFEEAGKCIAFERPTAAAFHLLRGTEDMIKELYCTLVKRDRIKIMMWGPMVEALRKHRKKPPAVLLDNLDNIRRSFRNPTQHPDKIYDIQEVQDLFGLCIDAVTRISTEIKKHN